MKNYIYQKFLLNCDYEAVLLEEIPEYQGSLEYVMPYGTDYCLFDVNRSIVRKLPLHELDTIVDTEEDWERFVLSLSNVDQLVIERSAVVANPIVQAYRQATLQAYCYRLQNAGIKIYFKTV